MHFPEGLTFSALIVLARNEDLSHVADVLQNILDLDLSNPDQCETYDINDPIDGDEEVSAELLSAIIEVIDGKLDDTEDDDDTGGVDEDPDDFDDDFDDDDGNDEDDPYDVSVDTLGDVKDFLVDVRAAL